MSILNAQWGIKDCIKKYLKWETHSFNSFYFNTQKTPLKGYPSVNPSEHRGYVGQLPSVKQLNVNLECISHKANN